MRVAFSVSEALQFSVDANPFIARGCISVFVTAAASGGFEIFRAHGPRRAEVIYCKKLELTDFLNDVFSDEPLVIEINWSWTQATDEQVAVLNKDEHEERIDPASPNSSLSSHQGNGWIYILTNISMPGIVKIGRTDRTPTERAAELSAATGVPTRFTLHWEAATGDAELAEAEIHRILDDKRVNDDREFFRVDPDSAIDVVAHVCAAFPALGDGCDADIQSSDDREDDLFLGSVQLLKQSGSIEPRIMRIKLGMTYDESYAIFNKMKSLGFIDSSGNSTQRG